MSEPSKSGGYVVQTITGVLPSGQTVVYSEAWKLGTGNVTTTNSQSTGSDDLFSGWKSLTANATYYDGLTLPDSYGYGRARYAPSRPPMEESEMSAERMCTRERWLRPKVLVPALFLMLAPNLPVSAQPVGQASVETAQDPSHVSRSADIIKAATVRRDRANAAIALSYWVRKNPGEVSDADMPILAGLLREDDDTVRREAANALGSLGARAKPFIPQLLAALEQRPCADQPAMSADAIHVALEQIGYGPMGFPCTDHERSPPQAH